MTAIAIAQNKRVLVVIDIAKARHEVLIAVAGKKHRRCWTVLNKFADLTRLIAALKDYSHPVRAAFEATGHYHRALAYHLVTAGFEVKLVSSVDLARARVALHSRWGYNDPKDAQVILHMMEFWMSKSIMVRCCAGQTIFSNCLRPIISRWGWKPKGNLFKWYNEDNSH